MTPNTRRSRPAATVVPRATMTNSLVSCAASVTTSVCDAKNSLSRRVEDMKWDFWESASNKLEDLYEQVLPQSPKDWKNYKRNVTQYTESGFPMDIDIISAHTKMDCNKSCQRALLEILALNMSNAERRILLEAKGSQFNERDALFKAVRMPYPVVPNDDSCMSYVLSKQKWYKKHFFGDTHRFWAIYDIIRANPMAFYQLVAV